MKFGYDELLVNCGIAGGKLCDWKVPDSARRD